MNDYMENLFEKEHEECVKSREDRYNDENNDKDKDKDTDSNKIDPIILSNAEKYLEKTNDKIDFVDLEYFIASGLFLKSGRIMKAVAKYLGWRILFCIVTVGIYFIINAILEFMI